MAWFLYITGGLVLVSLGKGGGGVTYPLLVAVTAVAPLSWVFYSILGKPIHEEGSPLLATFLSLILGSLPLFLGLSPGLLGKAWGMSLGQWGLPGFLSILCTVVGFALRNWLLEHLPASTVGFTVFLNPRWPRCSAISSWVKYRPLCRSWAGPCCSPVSSWP